MAGAKKRSPKKSPKRRAVAGAASKKVPKQLRVRMYRVGFGDFFLVTVPSADGPRHIVIDCGVTRGKTGKGDIATIKTAVRHMAKETGSKLSLIIVTHRHQDHIIGFSRCPEFSKFKVDAVWMPYWETEYAPKVTAFQAGLENVALSLRAAALAGDHDEHTDEVLAIVENATGMSLTEGPGGGTNKKSLELLKKGLGVKPEYYAKGDQAKLPSALIKAGLSATILGPPPADEVDFLKLMDLQKGVGQYVAAATAGRGRVSALMPFDSDFVVDASSYPATAFREFAPRSPGKAPDAETRHDRALEQAVKSATPAALFMAAKKLDAMLNNQSLVVLFEWKGKKLLFAGDAQGGNWEYWLFGAGVPAKDPSALKLSNEGKSILGSIDFYKVGHHGSTNATPIPAVEAMRSDFAAMCSVEAHTFGTESNNSEVPRGPLLDALEKKGALVRSDQIAVSVGNLDVPAGSKLSLPTPKKGRFAIGSCYVDYLLS